MQNPITHDNTSGAPKLRFSGFDKPWQKSKVGDVFIRILNKNKENNLNVLTISGQLGLISQGVYFNKSVSSKNLSGYYLINYGDFAYNKSYSSGYPMGAIKRLTKYKKGIVSPLYICFCLKSSDNIGAFFEHYFNAGFINTGISKIAQEGARNHGLLNISVIDFFNEIKINYPEPKEQERIASFLSLIDTWRDFLISRKLLLEKYKCGVIQKLFSQEIRLKENNGNNYPDWKDRQLNEVLKEHKLKSINNEPVYSVSVHKGLVDQIEHLGRSYAAKTTSHYNLVKPNDIVYTKSPTGEFPYGIIKQSHVKKNVIVSPLYGVFTPESPGLGYMLHVYFESPINTRNYLISIVRKGAKNTINITNNTFLSKSLKLPISIEEQNKIADFLMSIDRLIELYESKISLVNQWKKGLMQKLLI